MRLIKLAVISLIVFAVIIFLFSLLIPDHVRISRAVTISRPREAVAKYISDMRTWAKWNNMIIGQDSTNGTFNTTNYTGPKLTVALTSIKPDLISTSWKYASSTAIPGHFYLVQSLSDTTVVQWYFDFRLKWYPWEKFGSIIFDQQLGPPMEKSLVDLRNILESQAY